MAIIHQSGAFGGYQNTGFGGTRRKPPVPGTTGPSPWTPPTSAPPGTYDPSLDFSAENALTGYGYSGDDATTGRGRAGTDWTTGFGQAQTTHNANLGALGRALANANTGYDTSTKALGTSYTNLGTQQAGAARAAGVSGGGALQQALAKRTANQATDQGKLDTAISQFRADNTAATNTENTNWQDLVGQGNAGTTVADLEANPDAYGSLGRGIGRGLQDITTTANRGLATQLLFSGQLKPGDAVAPDSQIGRSQTYEAAQGGLLPTLPSGSYATLPGGHDQYGFAGVQYGPGTATNPYLRPLMPPSAGSVMGTGSAIGTGLDINQYRKGGLYYRKRR